MTLAALAATLGLYRAGRAVTDMVWRMIAATPEELGRRADAIVARPSRRSSRRVFR